MTLEEPAASAAPAAPAATAVSAALEAGSVGTGHGPHRPGAPAISSRRFTRLRPLLVVAVVVGGICGVRALSGGFIDLAVYRFGGVAVLDGTLYTQGTPGSGLPFTYPPFAALVMVPVAWVPFALAVAAWTVAGVFVLGLVVDRHLRIGRIGRIGRAGDPGRIALAVVTAGSLALEPVWQSLSFGQVNLFLLALVVFDLLRPERRWAGWMVGVAAGLKLTPLLFLVFLVMVGRFRAARTGALAFLATVGVGFALAPGASWTYWSSLLWDAGRVGGIAYSGNQSVMGVLYRLTGERPSTVVWFVVAGALALAVLIVAALAWRRGHHELGVATAALAMLLSSPISWSHHWVWAVPLVLALWPLSRAASVVTGLLFVSSMIWIPPRTGMQELDWTPLEQVVGNAYLLAALALAAYVGWLVTRPLSRPLSR